MFKTLLFTIYSATSQNCLSKYIYFERQFGLVAYAITQQEHDVISTLMRRNDVASKSIRRHLDVMDPLGGYVSVNKAIIKVNEFSVKGSNSAIFIFVTFLHGDKLCRLRIYTAFAGKNLFTRSNY